MRTFRFSLVIIILTASGIYLKNKNMFYHTQLSPNVKHAMDSILNSSPETGINPMPYINNINISTTLKENPVPSTVYIRSNKAWVYKKNDSSNYFYESRKCLSMGTMLTILQSEGHYFYCNFKINNEPETGWIKKIDVTDTKPQIKAKPKSKPKPEKRDSLTFGSPKPKIKLRFE